MREFVHRHVGRGIRLWRKYEHRLGVGALLVGFCFDFFLAKKPDSIVDNILLVSYLFIAGTVIILLNRRTARRAEIENPAEPLIFLLMLQFCFGGLASNLLVLYGKSGTLAANALFIALLVCLVFGNEFLRSRYDQLRFNIAVYYFLLLTYCIIAVPTFILHSIGPWQFLVSEGVSLLVIAPFFIILRIAVIRGRQEKRTLLEARYTVVGLFLIFTALYFLNIIPPVPLSLKDIGIYHSVLRDSSGNYTAVYEPVPWWEFWRDTSATFDYTPGASAYCFSAVYAPADLDAPIYHRWEHYNTATGSWDTVSRISFSISGGRADGYRGFTATAALSPGAWRCDVETNSGALIGRTSFTAVPVSVSPSLSQTTL